MRWRRRGGIELPSSAPSRSRLEVALTEKPEERVHLGWRIRRSSWMLSSGDEVVVDGGKEARKGQLFTAKKG